MYEERTQHCQTQTPFLTRNHPDSVPSNLTLASSELIPVQFGQQVNVTYKVQVEPIRDLLLVCMHTLTNTSKLPNFPRHGISKSLM